MSLIVRNRFSQAFDLIRTAWCKPTQVPEVSVWPTSSVPVGPILSKGQDVPIYIAGSTPETVGLNAALSIRANPTPPKSVPW